VHLSVSQRFWAKVEKGKCWEWRGARSRGYGCFNDGDRTVIAHRWSYEAARGPIPPGLTLDHLCRNRSCVNPAHLEIVTRKENVLRGVGVTARNASKVACVHGHGFTEENTYHWHGKRICKACLRDRDRARRAASKTKPHSRDRTHCPRGHPYAGDNVRLSQGKRYCRVCEKAKFKRWYDKHRRTVFAS